MSERTKWVLTMAGLFAFVAFVTWWVWPALVVLP